MRRKWKKLLSTTLALAMVITTIGVREVPVSAAEEENTNESVVYMDDMAYDTTTGHFYKLSSVGTYEQVNAEAKESGGYLACISSAEENEIVAKVSSTGKTTTSSYIGLMRNEENIQEWMWADGSEVNYTNWNEGEPNSENEKVAEIYDSTRSSGAEKWNDCTVSSRNTGVIEYNECIHPESQYVVKNKTFADCEQGGYTGDTYCTDCGELIKKGSATEKTDHNWKVTSEEKATCEKDGSKTFTCTECGETKTETTPKTGHKFSNWKTVKAQSIYSGAVQERTCNSCSKKETRIVGDKLKPVLKVNAPKLQLKRGQKTQKFTLTDIAKGDSVKSWVSSNKKIVTVSGKPNGTCIIKAGKKTGSAKITITMRSNLKKTIGVKVQKNAVACTSIKNVPKKLTLKRKRSYQLKPVINPITCTYKAKYKTSNKKIVKVTSKGKITAVKKGKAKITVMVGKKKFVCTVTVR